MAVTTPHVHYTRNHRALDEENRIAPHETPTPHGNLSARFILPRHSSEAHRCFAMLSVKAQQPFDAAAAATFDFAAGGCCLVARAAVTSQAAGTLLLTTLMGCSLACC